MKSKTVFALGTFVIIGAALLISQNLTVRAEGSRENGIAFVNTDLVLLSIDNQVHQFGISKEQYLEYDRINRSVKKIVSDIKELSRIKESLKKESEMYLQVEDKIKVETESVNAMKSRLKEMELESFKKMKEESRAFIKNICERRANELGYYAVLDIRSPCIVVYDKKRDITTKVIRGINQ